MVPRHAWMPVKPDNRIVLGRVVENKRRGGYEIVRGSMIVKVSYKTESYLTGSG
jgi:hypothetical protein